MTTEPRCHFLTGGDIAPEGIEPSGMFGALESLFRNADLSFLNVEHPLSQRGVPVRGKKFLHRGRNEHIQGLVDAGVSAINLANNHILDFGDDALLDTIAKFENNNIPCFGAGANISIASAPLLIEKNGLKIGLLGYTSTLPTGFAAGPQMAGVNPLRVRTAYRPAYNLDELPGTAPIIETWPDSEDLAQMTSSVANLKSRVDVVLVYVHWGVSMVPQVHEHQRTIGKAAIDAGADAVFGGHQHVVSAVEFHHGKPIVHCTGDLIFDVVEPWFDESTERNFLFGATLTKSGLSDCYALGCRTGVGRAPTLEPPGTPIGDKIVSDLKLFSEPYGTAVRVSGERILLSASDAQPFVPRYDAALHTMGYPSAALHEATSMARSTVKSSGEQYLK